MSSDLVPGLTVVRTYKLRWFPKDLVAGLILTTLLVPQGMAYASLAGLPPITGLYTSILCLATYAVFGPSKILVLGPDSSLGPMIAATILPLVGANGDPGRAVALASALALLTGGLTVLAGVGGLGFVADLISRPTMIGYLNGLALTIVVGQLPKLFGFSVEADGFLGEVAVFAAFLVGMMRDLLLSILRERGKEWVGPIDGHPLAALIDLLLIPTMVTMKLVFLGPVLTLLFRDSTRISIDQFMMTSAFFSVAIGILALVASIVFTRLRPTVRLWVKLSA